MAKVFAGRQTAQVQDPVAVFLIGMRINDIFAVHRWWPVFLATGPMLRELARFPEKGLLHSRTFWSGSTRPTWSTRPASTPSTPTCRPSA